MKTITLCYRKIIDADASRPWDQLVLEDSYRELRMQAQTIDPSRQHRTFAGLLQHCPGAEQLQFLVSGAVRGYLQQLNGTVPDIGNNLGQLFLKFTQFKFEIISSDLLDQSRHRVAVSFYSEPLHWLDTIGTYLLVAGQPAGPAPVLTQLVQLQPYLSIHSLQTEA